MKISFRLGWVWVGLGVAACTGCLFLGTGGDVSAQPAKKPPANCDVDADGHRAVSCGGDDCDDNDALRYPGNPEKCMGALIDGRSAADHDEDCNPCTIAGLNDEGDRDHDHVTSYTCTNAWPTAVTPPGCDAYTTRMDSVSHRVMGADCDDSNRAIIPGEMICPEGMPGVIRICAPVGVYGTSPPSHWDTRKCVGTCVPQVNGTGICIP